MKVDSSCESLLARRRRAPQIARSALGTAPSGTAAFLSAMYEQPWNKDTIVKRDSHKPIGPNHEIMKIRDRASGDKQKSGETVCCPLQMLRPIVSINQGTI